MTNTLHATVNQPAQRLTEQRVALDSIEDVPLLNVMLVRLACEDCAWWSDYQTDPGQPVLLRSLFGAALHRCPTTDDRYLDKPLTCNDAPMTDTPPPGL